MRSVAVLLLFISSLFVKVAHCQSDELTIQGQTGKLYLQHTVAAKENWYSIGRLYNLSPKVIAPFNSLTLANSLTIGQQLEIPLTTTNFSQDGVKDASETLVPVYHVVQEKEWMYRVSVNHNKVPIPSLEKWNHINKDQVRAGMHLIVGFLKVKTALSALAKSGGETVAMQKPPAPALASQPSAPAKEEAAVTPPSNTTTVPATTTEGTKPPVARTPVTTDETNNTVAPSVMPPAKNTAAANTPVKTPPANSSNPSINFNGGFFKSDFSNAGKSAEGQAGTFKSTSGWQDGKYYALMNNLPVGTIVRITSSNTRRSIYAKVLGQLPDMKESAGLTVRISNAAAGELGEGEGRFNVEVKY